MYLYFHYKKRKKKKKEHFRKIMNFILNISWTEISHALTLVNVPSPAISFCSSYLFTSFSSIFFYPETKKDRRKRPISRIFFYGLKFLAFARKPIKSLVISFWSLFVCGFLEGEMEGGFHGSSDGSAFKQCFSLAWKNPYVLRLAFSAGIGGLLFGYDTGDYNLKHFSSPFLLGLKIKRCFFNGFCVVLQESFLELFFTSGMTSRLWMKALFYR